MLELNKKNFLKVLRNNPGIGWMELASKFKDCTEIKVTAKFQRFASIAVDNGNIIIGQNMNPEIPKKVKKTLDKRQKTL